MTTDLRPRGSDLARRRQLFANTTQGCTRLALLFAGTCLANFALVMMMGAARRIGETTNPRDEPFAVGQLRTERKQFELFRLENEDDGVATADDSQLTSSEDTTTKPATTTSTSATKEHKRFELFSLPESEMRPEPKDTPQPKESTAPVSANSKVELLLFANPSCSYTNDTEVDRVIAKGPKALQFTPSTAFTPKSVRVQGENGGVVEVYVGPSLQEMKYRASIMAVEGCVNLYTDDSLLENKNLQFMLHSADNTSIAITERQQISVQLQTQFSTAATADMSLQQAHHTRIVYSSTSSEYFGYQLLANAMGFLQSNQTNASWMRLLSAKQPDDLSEKFPTFTAPTSLFSKVYSPINKADVIDKWMHSKDAPHPEDTIIVIDPDNWLLLDLHNWTKDVSSKRAVGQVAYYGWQDKAKELWQELCLENCDLPVDPVGVPYIVKASDLKEIAPLWRSYSISIMERYQRNATFRDYYGSLGVEWAAEMFGYNHACAHLQIKTKIVDNLQVRDTSSSRDWNVWSKTPMIHMGRASFPKDQAEIAAPWRHEDDGGFDSNGIQVWCKCNATAAKVQPWPIPEDLDFVSHHTLRLLHESKEQFGPVPANATFRREKDPYWAAP